MILLFINPPNFGQSQWSPISLVPYLIGPPIGTHAPPIPLVPLSLPPSLRLIARAPLSTLFSLVPHLIGPPMLPFLPCSHWSPISLVPQWNPGYTVFFGPPSPWSPNVILVIRFSLVPHLIDFHNWFMKLHNSERIMEFYNWFTYLCNESIELYKNLWWLHDLWSPTIRQDLWGFIIDLCSSVVVPRSPIIGWWGSIIQL